MEYGASTTAAAGTGATALAYTGANTFWTAVTAVALIGGGMLLLRLRPKKEV